jgi:hypothetical protein
MAKLTEKKWLEIRARYEAGEKAKDLAAEFKIKVNTIYQRAKRKRWKSRGALQDEAIAEAQEEIKEGTKDDYKDRVEKANADHTKFYNYPLKISILMMQAMDKRIAEAQANGENIKLGNDPYLLAQLASTMNMAITGIRTVNKYDAIAPDTGDPSLEKLFASFDEARKKRKIDESPRVVDELDESGVPDVEVPDGI